MAWLEVEYFTIFSSPTTTCSEYFATFEPGKKN